MVAKRALISVHDKTGVVEFARGLVDLGFEIVSSGGTHRHLQDNGISAQDVAGITGFNDLLGGRVKTLHPLIYAGILSRDTLQDAEELSKLGMVPFTVIAVNLYPFQKTVADPQVTLEMAMEQVDIGGVSLLRAGAKAHHRCFVICDMQDYRRVLQVLSSDADGKDLRRELAVKAFMHTTTYDAEIANFLEKCYHGEELPLCFVASYIKGSFLRYGENPHQRAALYLPLSGKSGPVAGGRQLSGRDISYNNYCDLDAAYTLVREFDKPGAVVAKHANPCGCAVDEDPVKALEKARAGDPVSAFGGIIAVNRAIDAKMAQVIVGPKGFFEALVAPQVTEEALSIIRSRKGWGERVIIVEAAKSEEEDFCLRWISGGLLLSDVDATVVDWDKLKVVTKRGVSDAQMADLVFAFTIVKHIKSNAIAVVRDGMLIGMGAGQPNRILSVQLALQNACEHHRGVEGAALASDGFFPMADAPTLAVQAGIKAIIQPGGSVKDEEVIKAMDEGEVAMVFTNLRHFRH